MNQHNLELTKYVNNINKIPLLTKQQERQLLLEYQQTKNPTVANTLITSNLRFVVKVAHSFKGYGHPMEDLIQEGNKAMMRALEKFDPNKNVRFCSYAVHWIKAYMGNYVMKNHSMVKFGCKKSEKEFFYNLKKKKELFEKLGSEDLTRELAEHFDVSEQEILLNLNRLNIKDYSLNNKVMYNGEEIKGFIASLTSEEPLQEENLQSKQEQEAIQDVMARVQRTLNERELFIVKNRLSSDDPMTLQEIGSNFGISRERTRQIEEALIKKLKRELEDFRN
jgi:RNA polymerase sigma-32 factor